MIASLASSAASQTGAISNVTADSNGTSPITAVSADVGVGFYGGEVGGRAGFQMPW